MYIVQVWDNEGYLQSTRQFKSKMLAEIYRDEIEFEDQTIKTTMTYQEKLFN